MRNIFRGIALFIAVAVSILCILDISNNGTKKKETSSLSETATFDPLKIKLTGEYDLENNDELIGEIVRNIAINKYSNSDIKIQVLGIDAKNGFIDLNIIQYIDHANGKTTKHEERRTVIVETEKVTSKYVYDFNNDGIVDEDDAQLIRDYLAGSALLSDSQKKLADINGDGVIDDSDAQQMLDKINNKNSEIFKTN